MLDRERLASCCLIIANAEDHTNDEKLKHDIFYAAALSATLSRSLSPGSVIVITLQIYHPFNIQFNYQLYGKHIPDTEELARSSA